MVLNMQDDRIGIFCAKMRMLPTDVLGMFTWVGIGAAIQNIITAANARGFLATVEYTAEYQYAKSAALIKLTPGRVNGHLADWIARRITNRSIYDTTPLVTAYRRDHTGYMEAGRLLEQLWLAATAKGLSVHPYGVMPQYLTKLETEPETFLQRHAATIRKHIEPFFSIFPEARNEYPIIVLRICKARKQSARGNIRLRPEQIMHK